MADERISETPPPEELAERNGACESPTGREEVAGTNGSEIIPEENVSESRRDDSLDVDVNGHVAIAPEEGSAPELALEEELTQSLPVLKVSLPEDQGETAEAPAMSRTLSGASSTQNSKDRELPAVPTESVTEPPGNVLATGIPLPMSTEGEDLRAPEPPKTPTRTSSRNAPTSTNPKPRVTAASLAQSNGTGQITISSMVFVVQALETIGASKEAKRRKQLAGSVQKALDAIAETAPETPTDPNVVFEPLQLACTLSNTQLTTTALDCIGKLISYSYFSIVPPHAEEGQPPTVPLIEKAIETICDCFQGDSTPDTVQLQIVKALLAAVLNDKVVVHGAGLLKAVRQTYNIFLLSRNSSNQQTAQSTLTQMVHTVFERVEVRLAVKEAYADRPKSESSTSLSVQIPQGDSADVKEEPVTSTPLGTNRDQEKITLQSFENRKSFDDERITDAAPTTVHPSPRKPTDAVSESADSTQEEEDEVYIKDAFLVFRAMCKLSIKTLPPEQIADLKSHGMRSKLLSLHLIHVILLHHMNVFISPLSTIKGSSSGEPTVFVHAIKQYLCLSLSRNAASAVGNVFEVGCEIFWLMLSNMRVMLKVCAPFCR
jgi:brefeldin A-inhibited guanine nucleotide-exchange protein